MLDAGGDREWMPDEPAVTAAMDEFDAYDAVLALLGARSPDATVCPSEVARTLAGATGGDETEPAWRSAMPAVHTAVDRLVAEGRVRLTWKGRMLPSRAGPYRIGRPVGR